MAGNSLSSSSTFACSPSKQGLHHLRLNQNWNQLQSLARIWDNHFMSSLSQHPRAFRGKHWAISIQLSANQQSHPNNSAQPFRMRYRASQFLKPQPSWKWTPGSKWFSMVHMFGTFQRTPSTGQDKWRKSNHMHLYILRLKHGIQAFTAFTVYRSFSAKWVYDWTTTRHQTLGARYSLGSICTERNAALLAFDNSKKPGLSHAWASSGIFTRPLLRVVAVIATSDTRMVWPPKHEFEGFALVGAIHAGIK